MSALATEESALSVAPVTGLRDVHIQHPDRPLYTAWCLAPVLGIEADRPATCPECLDLRLWEARRRWLWRREEYFRRHPNRLPDWAKDFRPST